MLKADYIAREMTLCHNSNLPRMTN